jgi:hypothetical protein
MTTNHTPTHVVPMNIWAGDAILGTVVHYQDQGYRFIPRTDAHKPSSKAWPTPQAAIPQWARKLIARTEFHIPDSKFLDIHDGLTARVSELEAALRSIIEHSDEESTVYAVAADAMRVPR